jgi:predicted DCC family thiol-disulfide oxidoreductase YuxK
MTGSNAKNPVGWVFYDGECAFCVRGVNRWGRIFARRGFCWLPLQTPDAAQRLGVTASAPHEQMLLLLADGRVVGGAAAWAVLFRSVWWLWPVGALLTLPGFRELGALIYRRIAQHRHCLGGSCELPEPP